MLRRAILAALALAALAAPSAHAGGEKADKKKGGGETYLQIEPVSATTRLAGGKRNILTVETGVDIPDADLRAYADKIMPRLRAAYVQVVQIYAAGLPPRTPPNPDFLSIELQRETDRVLGRKGARLLLGAILIN
jgi:hypothetical protein